MGHPDDPADDPPRRKLSRPRSLISSSYLSRRLEQHHKTALPLSPSTSYEVGDYPTFARSKSRERSPRQDTRSKLRAYLHAPRNGKADSSDDDDEGYRGLPGIAKGVKHRLSRVGTGSSTLHLSSSGASTSQLSSLSIPLLDEEDTARMVEEIKEKAYMDSVAALNHVSSPVDGDMHVDSIPSPIRRKSLYTPGIATRTPNDILRKPPPPQKLQSQADRDYYFNPNLPASSPLARLVALEVGKSGRSTPNLDYSHLGGLGLGTLRVTNGPPSPKAQENTPCSLDTPTLYSVDKDLAGEVIAKVESHEQALLVVDGPVQAEDKISNTSPSISEVGVNSELSKAGQEQNQDTDSKRRGPRSVSPLKYEHIIDDKDLEETSSGSAHTKWLHRKHSLPSGFFSTASDQATTNALDYMQELPDTPFRRAQTTGVDRPNSKHDSNSDENDKVSFEDEGLVMCKSYRSTLAMWRSFVHDADQKKTNSETREDAYRKLNSNSTRNRSAVSRPTSSSASTKTTDLRSICTDPSTVKSSKKADSGYSSSESLALWNKASTDDVAVPSSDAGTSKAGSKKLIRLSGPRKLPRSLSRKARTNDATISTNQGFSCPTMVIPAQPVPSEVCLTRLDASLPKRNAASETLVVASPRSVSKTRKLRKSKSQWEQLPVNSIVFQGTRTLSQSHIPQVPANIASKHAERLREFPLLDHTFPSLQHVDSDESLFRGESKSVPIRFPSPVQSLETADSICNGDLEWTSSRSNQNWKIKSASKSSSRNSSKARRRSSQSEGVISITDFGTVIECLGGSPYDAAQPASSNSWKRATISHPHQLGASMPRAKSMTDVPNEAALQLAKLRSRFSTQSFSRPFESSFGRFGGFDKGNMMRPHSMIVDAPPVPALPAEYTSREIKRITLPPLEMARQEAVECERHSENPTRPQGLIIEIQALPAMPAEKEVTSKSPDSPQAFEPRRKTFNDRGGVPGKLARPRSIIADAPPVPVLPSKSQLEHIEAQVFRSNSSKTNVVAAPTKEEKFTESEVGARENCTRQTLQSGDRPQAWKSLGEAWAQRRKSAGDALLLRSRTDKSSQAPAISDGSTGSLELEKPTAKFPDLTNCLVKPGTPIGKYTRSPLRNILQSQSPLPVESHSIASQKSRDTKERSAADLGALTGRFAGGFHYGYEPGLGLGGSAGTRLAKSTASRKSINVSRGYGLDLSDVPIFVTPR